MVTNSISDDHNGLDTEVSDFLYNALNKYRKKNGFPILRAKIHIGILSLSNDSDSYIPDYSSNKKHDINCFDFYQEYEKASYINGKLIE